MSRELINKLAPLLLVGLITIVGLRLWSDIGDGTTRTTGDGVVSDRDLVEETTTTEVARTFISLRPVSAPDAVETTRTTGSSSTSESADPSSTETTEPSPTTDPDETTGPTDTSDPPPTTDPDGTVPTTGTTVVITTGTRPTTPPTSDRPSTTPTSDLVSTIETFTIPTQPTITIGLPTITIGEDRP